MAKLPGAGFAQSGGKDSSFGGGKGGNAYGANSTRSKTKGANRNATGASYVIRNNGGDKTPTRQGKTAAANGAGGLKRAVTRNYRKPANG
jgi:hypothetical protein